MPETSVVPAWPSTVTSRASMAPECLAAMENRSPAPSRTRPPGAWTVPVFSTPGFSALGAGAAPAASASPSILTMTWLPISVRSTSFPATMVTRPCGAMMDPWLATWRPRRWTALPRIVPRFSTAPAASVN